MSALIPAMQPVVDSLAAFRATSDGFAEFVSQQLDALEEMHAQLEEEKSTIRQRAAWLAGRSDELETAGTRLAQAQAQLVADRHAWELARDASNAQLVTERQAFETWRDETAAELTARGEELQAEQEAIHAGVAEAERRAAELAKLEQAHTQNQSEFEALQTELASSIQVRQELEEAAISTLQRLEEVEKELADLNLELEAARTDCRGATETLVQFEQRAAEEQRALEQSFADQQAQIESQRVAAEEALTARITQLQIENDRLHVALESGSTASCETLADLDAAEAELKAERAARAQFEERCQQLEGRLAAFDAQKSLEGTLQAELERITAEAERIRTEAEASRSELEQARSQEAQARTQALEAASEVERAQAEMDQACAEAAGAQAESERLRAEAESARAANEQLRLASEQAREEADQARLALEQASEEAKTLRKLAEQAAADADSARAVMDEGRGEWERLRTQAENSRAEMELARAEAEELRKALEAALAAAEQAGREAISSRQSAGSSADMMALETELGRVTSQRDELRTEIDVLRTQNARLAGTAVELADARAELANARAELAQTRQEMLAEHRNSGLRDSRPVTDDALEGQLEELERERSMLESELESLRNRAAELAETAADEKRRNTEERAQWAGELKQLRRALETQSYLLTEKHSAKAEQPAQNDKSAGSDASADPAPNAVLDSVMAQFEMLQKDRLRRRTGRGRGGRQEVA